MVSFRVESPCRCRRRRCDFLWWWREQLEVGGAFSSPPPQKSIFLVCFLSSFMFWLVVERIPLTSKCLRRPAGQPASVLLCSRTSLTMLAILCGVRCTATFDFCRFICVTLYVIQKETMGLFLNFPFYLFGAQIFIPLERSLLFCCYFYI